MLFSDNSILKEKAFELNGADRGIHLVLFLFEDFRADSIDEISRVGGGKSLSLSFQLRWTS